MNVQPYFPEPLHVEGNVADEEYGIRLRFIRRVVALHFLTGIGVFGAAMLVPSGFTLSFAAGLFGLHLVALSTCRVLAGRKGLSDIVSSVMLLPGTMISLGFTLGLLNQEGVPMWPLGLSVALAASYTALCGRDFSFVGQFMLGAIASIAVILAGAYFERIDAGSAWVAIVFSVASLLYYVYDLAALLTRRRLGEEFAAVADLYRDSLNVLTYSFRVIQHWRRFRI